MTKPVILQDGHLMQLPSNQKLDGLNYHGVVTAMEAKALTASIGDTAYIKDELNGAVTAVFDGNDFRRSTDRQIISQGFPDAVYADFYHNDIYQRDGVTVTQDLNVTRPSPGVADQENGQLITFQPNEARITDKGLLIETAATNINQYSTNHPDWTGYGTTTPIVSQDVLFDGIQGVSVHFDENSNTGFGGSRATHIQAPFSIDEGVEYTASYRLKLSRKLVAGEEIHIYCSGGYGGWIKVVKSSDDFTVPQKVEVTQTKAWGGTASVYFVVYLKTPLQSPVTVYVGNRQFEAAGKASSYIATSGGSAIRPDDIIRADTVATGMANMTKGIMCLEFDIPVVPSSGYPRILEISDGTQNNVIAALLTPAGDINLRCWRDGGQTHDQNAVSNLTSGRHKIVIGFDGGDISHSVDGSVAAQYFDKLPNLSTLQQANLGSALDGSVETSMWIRSFFILDELPLAARLQELSAL